MCIIIGFQGVLALCTDWILEHRNNPWYHEKTVTGLARRLNIIVSMASTVSNLSPRFQPVRSCLLSIYE